MPQIRPLADIVHFKYAPTYLLTYLLTLGYEAAILDIDPPRGSTLAMVAVSLDVLCVVENTYIVLGTTCLSVTTAKLLLIPVSQPPSSIIDITRHRPISFEIRMFHT